MASKGKVNHLRQRRIRWWSVDMPIMVCVALLTSCFFMYITYTEIEPHLKDSWLSIGIIMGVLIVFPVLTNSYPRDANKQESRETTFHHE